jgi:electron transfer flavoprotein alpha subunit
MGHDVLVVAEHLRGRLAEVTYELAGKGRELASALGGRLAVALLGQDVQPLASSLGAADAVLCLEAPELAEFTPEAHVRALAGLVAERQPRLVMVANTSMGMDLAAALSARLNIPLVSYCSQIAVEDGQVVATSRLYGGKMMAESVLAERGIIAVLAGSFPAEVGKVSGNPAVESMAVSLNGLRTRFRQLIEPEAGDVDITKADILVCVGRGIQDKANIPMVEELAGALGGALCASRPIVDSGWLPKNRQVGKSGLAVKPKLYIAVGVSGAPEHLEGMKGAGLIVAINSDPNAPIFDVADYGVVGDLFEITPALTEKIGAAAR